MSQIEMLLDGNLEEIAYSIKMNKIMELPFILKFADNLRIQELEKIYNASNSSKITLNIIKALKKFDDYTSEIESVYFSKLKFLINCFGKNSDKVLNIINEKVNTIHQMKDIIPYFNKKYSDDLLKCLYKIKKYKKETFLDIIFYLNYKIIRQMILEKNSSTKEILLVIEKIKKGFLLREETIAYKKEYGDNYKELLFLKRKHSKEIHTYISNLNIKGLSFIKCPIKASFWGKETKCCLNKNGVAKDLLDIIELSPIAGEIVGEYYGNKLSSFTWDMVEIIDGVAYKNLVLDNIESPNVIPYQITEKLFNDINDFTEYKYKNIYLGTVRDDCTVDKKYKIKERQSTIVGFDNILKKSVYTTADSKELYIMRTNKEDNNFKWRKMNISDLHLVKYIENYVYGKNIYEKNDKTDILKLVTLDTPCYIVDSNTTIKGYLLTKWKYFDKDGNESFEKLSSKKFYIEDLVMSKDKKSLIQLKYIFKDLLNWLKENKIKEVYLNANNNSKNFIKRLLKEGISVKSENIGSIIPINYLK